MAPSVRQLLDYYDMKRALLAVLVLSAACDRLSPPAPASMPWLHGFNAVAVTDTSTSQASRRIASLLDTAIDDDTTTAASSCAQILRATSEPRRCSPPTTSASLSSILAGV